MKTIRQIIGKLAVGCVFACRFASTLHAQTAPQLSISKTSSTSVSVNWTNQIGTSYRVWFATNLAGPFALLEDWA